MNRQLFVGGANEAVASEELDTHVNRDIEG